MSEIVKAFFEQGIVGVSVIALAITVWRLYREQQKTQTARISEAQAVADRLIKLSESWIVAIKAQTTVVEHQNSEVAALRVDCRDRTDENLKAIRELTTELRVANRGKGGGGA